MLEELWRRMDACQLPLPLDNDGANPGDLWGVDYGDGGRYIGNIDEPLYADVIIAAVNVLPKLRVLVKAAHAMYESLDDSRLDRPRPLEEHTARFHLGQALAALRKAGE